MTEPRDPGFHDDGNNLNALYEKLGKVLNDADLKALLKDNKGKFKKGPIFENQLPDEVRYSDELDEFTLDMDWPSRRNTEKMRTFYPERFSDARDFWVNLFVKDGEKGMNSFRGWLSADLVYNRSEITRESDIYGSNPALHRAYIVAEPLMTTLKKIITTITYEEPRGEDQEMPSLDESQREALMKGEGTPLVSNGEVDKLGELQLAGFIDHPELAEAAYTAYILIGRLMTDKDDETMYRKLGYDDRLAPKISSAHERMQI